jgi:hypothetical protein
MQGGKNRRKMNGARPKEKGENWKMRRCEGGKVKRIRNWEWRNEQPMCQSATSSRTGGMKKAPRRSRGHALLVVADMLLIVVHNQVRPCRFNHEDLPNLVIIHPDYKLYR